MIKYLNWRGPKGRETIDQLSRADFTSWLAFYREQRRLVSEYAMCGHGGCYWSQRPCAGWLS